MQGLYSRGYSAGPVKPCEYCCSCTALGIVWSLNSPAYIARPLQSSGWCRTSTALPHTARPTKRCVYGTASNGLCIMQGRQSPVYSTGPTQPCIYRRACTALRIVQGMHSCPYSVRLVQPCVYTVKTFELLQPYFWSSQLHVCCVRDKLQTSRDASNLVESLSVVETLLLFVKLGSSCRKSTHLVTFLP